MGEALAREEVLALLTERLAAVLARPAAQIGPDDRFDADLHADSLDLVETVEAVEAELARRGVAVRLADDELLTLRTVGEAADLLHARLAG